MEFNKLLITFETELTVLMKDFENKTGVNISNVFLICKDNATHKAIRVDVRSN